VRIVADKLTAPSAVNVILLRGISFPQEKILKTFLRGEEGISITSGPAKHLKLKPVVLSSVEVPGYTTIHPFDSYKLSIFLYENLNDQATFFWDFPFSLYQKDPEALLEIFTKTVDILRGKKATSLFLIGGKQINERVLMDVLKYADTVLELRRHETRVDKDVRGFYSLHVTKHLDPSIENNEYVLLIRDKGIRIVEPPGKKEYELMWKVKMPPLPSSMLKTALEHNLVPAKYKLELVKRGLGRMLAFMGEGILWTTGSEVGLKIISKSCKKVGEYDGKDLIELLKTKEPTVKNGLKLCLYASKVLGLKSELTEDKILTFSCPYLALVKEAENQLCCYICEMYRKGVIEALSPEIRYTMTKSMGRGDEFCEGVVEKRKKEKNQANAPKQTINVLA
jgi:hypothetical protein